MISASLDCLNDDVCCAARIVRTITDLSECLVAFSKRFITLGNESNWISQSRFESRFELRLQSYHALSVSLRAFSYRVTLLG